MKTCKTCGATKLLDQFGRRAVSPDGRRSKCKACRSSHVSAYKAAIFVLVDASRKKAEAYAAAWDAMDVDRLIAIGAAYHATNRQEVAARLAAWAKAAEQMPGWDESSQKLP